jgi:hypothetical protein
MAHIHNRTSSKIYLDRLFAHFSLNFVIEEQFSLSLFLLTFILKKESNYCDRHSIVEYFYLFRSSTYKSFKIDFLVQYPFEALAV